MKPYYTNKKVFTVGFRGDTLRDALAEVQEYIQENGEKNLIRGYVELESENATATGWLIELQVSTHETKNPK